MCSEKGYAHRARERGKKKEGIHGALFFEGDFHTFNPILEFFIFVYLFVFVCFVYTCGLHIHLLVQICVDVFAHMCIPEDNLISQHSQGTVYPSFSQWSAICQAD